MLRTRTSALLSKRRADVSSAEIKNPNQGLKSLRLDRDKLWPSPSFQAGCGRGRPRSFLLIRFRLPSLFLFLGNDRGDGLQFVFPAEIDQFDPLRVPPGLSNRLHGSAHHLTLARDEHDFLLLLHGKRPNDITGPVIGLHGDDPFAAARLQPVLGKPGALPDPILTRHQQRRI